MGFAEYEAARAALLQVESAPGSAKRGAWLACEAAWAAAVELRIPEVPTEFAEAQKAAWALQSAPGVSRRPSWLEAEAAWAKALEAEPRGPPPPLGAATPAVREGAAAPAAPPGRRCCAAGVWKLLLAGLPRKQAQAPLGVCDRAVGA
ncbi:unnamed protein product [Prorocentrum cordatum]|uniref:Uncharacterized protein n=1 Tax=Prorocentrum cordatum TaxID=2364126 RepID=A0ABN9QVV5_9DINO|nr:unnamed protein product [Polarella glacialis]